MSLSVIWWEHEDALRVEDSLGDEVDAYFGEHANILLAHRAFGESFSVHCSMIKEFEHSKREITSSSCITHILSLGEVINILTLRRSVLRAVRQKLEDRLELAIKEVLTPTRISTLAADFARDALQSEEWRLDPPIMIHYLTFVLARFNEDERLDLSLYTDELGEFEEYLLKPKLV